MVHTAVIELQITRKRLDGHLAERIVGTRCELATYGIGLSDDIVGHDGAIAFINKVLHIRQRALAIVIIARMQVVGLQLEQR